MSSAAFRPRPLPRHPRVWWSRLKVRWPFIIWVSAILLAMLLAYESGQLGAVEGYVEARHEEAAAFETAILTSVNVRPGDHVRPGDVLATFDASALESEIASTAAEISLDHARFERQFARDLVDMRVRMQELRMQQAVDESRYEALKARRGTLNVSADPLGSDSRGLALYDAEQKALAKAVDSYPVLIQAMEEDARQLEAQLAATRDAQTSGAPTGDQAGLPAAAARDLLQTLESRRGLYTLRAKTAGVVADVLYGPGAVVREGLPVVRILREEPRLISALVPEHEARGVSTGQPVWVTSAISGQDAFPGQIVAISPEIVTVTNEFGVLSGQLKRGRRVTAQLDEAQALLPGERVTMLLHNPGWVRWYRGLINRTAEAKSPPAGNRS